MRMQLLSALLLQILFNVSSPYKILVYSNLFGHSHIKFVGSVVDTLVDAGHDVVCFLQKLDFRSDFTINYLFSRPWCYQ